ncbi:MAG: glycosyltransferase [Verrucomicrobiales bacterium]|nr:glycosyltransferase [Nitrospinaceae bacterium]
MTVTPSKSEQKVTVIIPCYNREDFIQKTIDSALNQSYPYIEIVVVDDGCTDSSRKIVDSYRSKIRVLEHPGRMNKGQSSAINLAMHSTDGGYIAILDSDDFWEPDKVKIQVNYLENNPGIDLIYVNGHAVDEKGRKLYQIFQSDHIETNDPEKVLLNCYLSIPSNSLVRRAAFISAGDFDENLRSAQDHDMAVRLAETATFAFINKDLWFYRRHPNTQSQKHAKRRWEMAFLILKKAFKRYPYGLSVRRKRLAVINFRIGQCFLAEGRFLMAIARFLISGLLDPVRAMRVLFRLEQVGAP